MCSKQHCIIICLHHSLFITSFINWNSQHLTPTSKSKCHPRPTQAILLGSHAAILICCHAILPCYHAILPSFMPFYPAPCLFTAPMSFYPTFMPFYPVPWHFTRPYAILPGYHAILPGFYAILDSHTIFLVSHAFLPGSPVNTEASVLYTPLRTRLKLASTSSIQL